MTWLWIVLGVVIGLPLAAGIILVLIGFMLRRDHVATRSVAYRADPHRVWTAISDWERHPGWRSGVKQMERLPDRNGRAVWKEVRRRGDTLTQAVEVFDPAARRMVTRIVDERAFGGTWTWTVTPQENGGAALTITEAGEVYNPLFRAISRFFLDPRSTMDQLHRDLAAHLGEPPPALPR
ncbi:MAG: SRPBCC family protein [Bauldia sp.]|nr:SRPBCC family protein [Bauldia sp.]